MRWRDLFFVFFTTLALGMSHSASARVFIGFGMSYPYYYYPGPVYYAPYPPYPSYSPPVVDVPGPIMQQSQPTYIEQGQNPDNSNSSGNWYYCDASKTYYPYVKECVSGWRAVPATPPPPN